MAKFQQQAEQSPTSPSHSQVSQSVPKPPVQKRPENLSHPPKVAPPPPLRMRDKTPADTKIQKPETQESSSAHIKTPPQRPPRAKDREQNKQTAQESPSLQTKMAPPKPPRIKDKTPADTKIQKPETQESSSAHIKTPPQRPPRAKDREQNKQTAQESPSLQTKMAPPKPPRIKDKTPADTKIQKPETQESSSAHIKTPPQRPPRAKDREQNKQTAQESPSLQTKMAPPKPPRIKDKTPADTKIQKPETQESSSAHIKTPPPKPPRAKDREQNKQTAQESPSLQTKMPPPTPPRIKDKTPANATIQVQTSTKNQNLETIAPSVRPKTPQHRQVRQQSSSSSQNSESYAVPPSRKPHQIGDRQKSEAAIQKTAIRQPKPSQERKASINTMEKKLLLEAYHEEIRFLCKKTFGDRLILESRIEAIKENPNMGEQLLWDVTKKPQSISKLAGRKVLGIKNGARKQAEETLSPLYAAIEGFVYTAKYVQENTSQNSHTKQQQHQQAQQEGAISQHARNPLHSEKKIQPLSNQEIARRVQQNPSVQYGQREVQYWCQKVYRDPFIFNDRMEDMQKIPEIGEELVWQIENHSQLFTPLAGKKVLGVKNEARKTAEESLSTLCTAIKDYADTIKQVRESIVLHNQEQQKHHQPLSEIDKKLQKQQSLSQSAKPLERSTVKQHKELTEASKQEERPPIRPRKAETSKTMALS